MYFLAQRVSDRATQGRDIALRPTATYEGEVLRRLSLITIAATAGLAMSVPALAQAKPALRATGADDGVCKVLVTASWSGARVNSVKFTLSTNATSYASAPVLLGGAKTVETSGFEQYTFTVTTADTSGLGVADFLSANGRVVGSASTDPVEFACS